MAWVQPPRSGSYERTTAPGRGGGGSGGMGAARSRTTSTSSAPHPPARSGSFELIDHHDPGRSPLTLALSMEDAGVAEGLVTNRSVLHGRNDPLSSAAGGPPMSHACMCGVFPTGAGAPARRHCLRRRCRRHIHSLCCKAAHIHGQQHGSWQRRRRLRQRIGSRRHIRRWRRRRRRRAASAGQGLVDAGESIRGGGAQAPAAAYPRGRGYDNGESSTRVAPLQFRTSFQLVTISSPSGKRTRQR